MLTVMVLQEAFGQIGIMGDTSDELGIKLDSEFRGMVNSTGKDIHFDIPNLFSEELDDKSITISSNAPGTLSDSPYIYLNGRLGSEFKLAGFDLDGEIKLYVNSDVIEAEIDAHLNLFNASLEANGQMSIYEDGVVTKLGLAGELNLDLLKSLEK